MSYKHLHSCYGQIAGLQECIQLWCQFRNYDQALISCICNLSNTSTKYDYASIHSPQVTPGTINKNSDHILTPGTNTILLLSFMYCHHTVTTSKFTDKVPRQRGAFCFFYILNSRRELKRYKRSNNMHNTVVFYGTITAQSNDLFGRITTSIHSSTAVA
jgi:hypothetical protein